MKKEKKRCELDNVWQLLRRGKSKSAIQKELGIGKTALSNHLGKLDKLGFIERTGKFEIKILSSSLYTPRVTKNQVHFGLNKRGHAYNFKIVFPKEINLLEKNKVRQAFIEKEIFKLPFGSFKFIKDKNTIWINKNSFTIYSNNSYYSSDALHSKFRALREIDSIALYLKDRFELRGIYGIEIFREHYGIIFNKFAEWLNKRQQKLYVKEKGNKSILWVDNSRKDDIGLNEFEGNNPISINKAESFFASHERQDWKVDADFVLNGFKLQNQNINKVMKTQEMFAQNIESHVSAIQELAIGVRELREEVKKLNKPKDL